MTVHLQNDERIDDLCRQGLKVIQSASAPGFSMDAILLADFAQVKCGERLIDLGTGTGVIALLLMAKQPECFGYGLELMPEMAELASRSVLLNGLEERLKISCGDIRQASDLYGRANFDVVVSNPPYYKDGAGRISGDQLRAAARSERYCHLEELLDSVAALLKPLGRFYIVHRAERLGDLLAAAAQRQLRCVRLRMVQPRADSPANLLLAQFTFHSQERLLVEAPLVVYQASNVYSEEMMAIYQGREE